MYGMNWNEPKDWFDLLNDNGMTVGRITYEEPRGWTITFNAAYKLTEDTSEWAHMRLRFMNANDKDVVKDLRWP